MKIKDLTIEDLRNIKTMLENLVITYQIANDSDVKYVKGVLDRNNNYTNIMNYLEYAIPNIEDYLNEPNDETTITITYL